LEPASVIDSDSVLSQDLALVSELDSVQVWAMVYGLYL
jgi:hypothetical protein